MVVYSFGGLSIDLTLRAASYKVSVTEPLAHAAGSTFSMSPIKQIKLPGITSEISSEKLYATTAMATLVALSLRRFL